MASNRIKGITIEIGGDTKKLDKALSGTNKQLNDTQKNLKDVERLLKMDPGNTELLAQKQRLLSDAVAGTSQKLNTLREAAKTADDALARGKGYEEKYRPLKEELDSTSAALAELRDAQSRMEADLASGKISAEAYEAYQAEVEETEQKLNDLKAAQKSLEAEFAGAKLNQDQYDALQREIIETELALKDAEDAMEDFTSASSKFSSAVSGISSKAGSFANATKGISTAAAGLITAATATVPATDDFRAAISMLGNNARQAGVDIGAVRGAFQQLYAITGEVDSSVEAVSNLLQAGFTESNLQYAVENLAGAALAFPETLKIESLADSLQETLATGKATGQFAEALERLGYSTEQFNEHLLFTHSGIDSLSAALGFLAEKGMASSYRYFVENNEALISSRNSTLDLQESIAEFAATVLPFVTKITELLGRLLDSFSDLPPEVQIAIGAFTVLISTISPIASTIAAISAAVSVAGISFTTFTPVILGVVIALAALAVVIGVLLGKTDEMKSIDLAEGLPDVGSLSTSSITPASLPHLARGTVTRPNSPYLAVVGDNPTEPEIISPYSTIKRAAAEGLAEMGYSGGGGGTLDVTLLLDGAVLARKAVPYFNREYTMRGTSLVR